DQQIEYVMLNASPLKYVKRGRDTKIPQSSGPLVKVGDGAIHKELGDRMKRAATTASSLEAEQDSAEEDPSNHGRSLIEELDFGCWMDFLCTTTAGVKAKDKGKAIIQESEPPKKIKKRAFIPMGSEIKKEVMKRSGFDLQQESSKPVEEEIVQQHDVITKQAVKESSRTARGRRKKSLARKRAKETLSEESAKKQKLEDNIEKEELQVYLDIVPEEESFNIESLATKYPIVDWVTQILANDQYYYQIKRADGSVKHYKIFSAMLYDFDRQDVLELYKLVKERFQTASPEGYDLLLWGDLKTMMEPNEVEIWRNQQDWNLIN
ncbi:hypothetical protein Tco_0961760, partial [Tanacetum coccineum]